MVGKIHRSRRVISLTYDADLILAKYLLGAHNGIKGAESGVIDDHFRRRDAALNQGGLHHGRLIIGRHMIVTAHQEDIGFPKFPQLRGRLNSVSEEGIVLAVRKLRRASQD
jgi:hypothetical protein